MRDIGVKMTNLTCLLFKKKLYVRQGHNNFDVEYQSNKLIFVNPQICKPSNEGLN